MPPSCCAKKRGQNNFLVTPQLARPAALFKHGAGEGGIIPVGGVLANALAGALSSLGVQPRELPLTPPRVWQWIRESGRI